MMPSVRLPDISGPVQNIVATAESKEQWQMDTYTIEGVYNRILTRVYTSSLWDCCEFGIFDLTLLDISLVKRGISIAKSLADQKEFLALSYSCWTGEFFSSKEDLPGITELITDENPWIYIDIDKAFYRWMQRPENKIVGREIKIDKDGFLFTGFGKHTAEDFWTPELPLQLLDNLCNDK